MPIHYMPSTEDLRVLLSRILLGESAKEKLARDKEEGTSAIEDQRPLPAFFFVCRPRAQYFEVQAAVSSLAILPANIDLDAMKTVIKQAIKEAKAKAHHQVTKLEEARKPNPWLQRVRQVKHLGAFNQKELQAFVALVKDDKPKLDVLYKVFNQLI